MIVVVKPDGTKEVSARVVNERIIPFKAAAKAVDDGRKYFVIE